MPITRENTFTSVRPNARAPEPSPTDLSMQATPSMRPPKEGPTPRQDQMLGGNWEGHHKLVFPHGKLSCKLQRVVTRPRQACGATVMRP